MFFGVNLKTWLYIGAAFLVVSTISGIAVLAANLNAANAEKKILQQQVNTQQEVIDQQRRDLDLIRNLSEDIQEGFSESRRDVRRLSNRIDSLNLREEALINPAQVQATINQETAWMLRCNEIVTGDEPTEADADNQVCPELLK